MFSYTQRGLFDRDKLTVLSLLTFRIMLQARAAVVVVGVGMIPHRDVAACRLRTWVHRRAQLCCSV